MSASYAGTSTCWDCGRVVKHKPQGGPQRFHACRLRLLERRAWNAHQAGWHSGYRFAVENAQDPMVRADGDDYGTGWAGHMRAGHVLAVEPSV